MIDGDAVAGDFSSGSQAVLAAGRGAGLDGPFKPGEGRLFGEHGVLGRGDGQRQPLPLARIGGSLEGLAQLRKLLRVGNAVKIERGRALGRQTSGQLAGKGRIEGELL